MDVPAEVSPSAVMENGLYAHSVKTMSKRISSNLKCFWCDFLHYCFTLLYEGIKTKNERQTLGEK